MKVLTIQSFSDVITNSSSEVFILNTNHTCEEVNSILNSFTTGFNYPEVFDLKKFREWRKDHEEFSYSWPPTLFEVVLDQFYDTENEEDILAYQTRYLNYPFWCDSDDELIDEYIDHLIKSGIYEVDPEFDPHPRSYYMTDIPDSFVKSFPRLNEITVPEMYDMVKLDGKICVLSGGDNTMSYTDFDMIEKKFDAYRIHLG